MTARWLQPESLQNKISLLQCIPAWWANLTSWYVNQWFSNQGWTQFFGRILLPTRIMNSLMMRIVWFASAINTVDGSEIPWPTTVWMYKPHKLWDKLPSSTGFFAGFLNHQQYWYGVLTANPSFSVSIHSGTNRYYLPGTWKTSVYK